MQASLAAKGTSIKMINSKIEEITLEDHNRSKHKWMQSLHSLLEPAAQIISSKKTSNQTRNSWIEAVKGNPKISMLALSAEERHDNSARMKEDWGDNSILRRKNLLLLAIIHLGHQTTMKQLEGPIKDAVSNHSVQTAMAINQVGLGTITLIDRINRCNRPCHILVKFIQRVWMKTRIPRLTM